MASQYIQKHKDRFISELIEWLKIPSVSADSKYKNDVQRAAEYVRSRLLEAGVSNAEICPTKGHPIVYAEKINDPAKPTILVYGHYDVQPADPLNLWTSPPFEPVIKDEKIYARGACDDKGQVYMHVKAFEMMMKENTLACNVKFIIEGEEEVGSANLEEFIRSNTEKLKADIVLISDTEIFDNKVPSICVGLRGLSYMEVTLTGPNRDLHSGVYGGAVANPVQVLCEMITSLKDKNNHITIPGFYKDVLKVSNNERKLMAKIPFKENAYKKDLGVKELRGEKGYTTLERVSVRPTLELNGIWGGYTGEGSKTVLPSKASAKISMRLVPNQTSKKISGLFAKHFRKIAPPSMKVEVKEHHGGEPAVTPIDSPAYLAACKAMRDTFGKEPIPTRGGGSIPIVALFEKVLGLKSVLMGFGLESDNIHSPNEKFGVFNFLKGIETIPLFYKYYAEMA
ncbi:MAG: peptidase dimerization domain protein [Bacteroidetes bacterium RIFCSPLOWO2_02_FULL_36_8]|nr:MAG: peptidase dimerization domain protein [Bacteroidetes bacterium RIFCSPLOWO2_02_FULL_36_8]OFY70523.1 MAG: peptidase dimerization domain protein [Bacteroidetes bacterium RIFCSPLOWO2_12_FULL_37_12]